MGSIGKCLLSYKQECRFSELDLGIFASCDERGLCTDVVSFHSDISFTYVSHGWYIAFSYALQIYADGVFKNISTPSDLVQQIGVSDTFFEAVFKKPFLSFRPIY